MDKKLILIDDAINFYGYLIPGKRSGIKVGLVVGLVSSSCFVGTSTDLQTVLHDKRTKKDATWDHQSCILTEGRNCSISNFKEGKVIFRKSIMSWMSLCVTWII